MGKWSYRSIGIGWPDGKKGCKSVENASLRKISVVSAVELWVFTKLKNRKPFRKPEKL